MLRYFTLACLAALTITMSVVAQAPAQPRVDSLGDPLPSGAIARIGSTRLKHTPELDVSIGAASFSADGKLIVSRAGVEGTIRLWDANTGQALAGPWNDNKRYTAVAISPDCSVLAAADYPTNVVPPPGVAKNVEIFLWDIRQAKLLHTLIGHPNFVRALAFADGGKSMVSAGNGSVCSWDLAAGKVKREWKPFDKEERVGQNGRKEFKYFINPCLSPDATHMAVEAAWRETESSTATPGANEFVGLDLVAEKVCWRTTGQFADRLPRFAFSADGKRVAIPSSGNKLEVRESKSGKLVAPLQDVAIFGIGTVGNLALSPDGGTVAILGKSSQLVLWTVDGGAPLRKLVIRATKAGASLTQCVGFSPDGKTLLASSEASIQMHDVATLKEMPATDGHPTEVGEVAFSNDGKQLYTASALSLSVPGELAVWDVANWKRLLLTSYMTPRWPNLGFTNLAQTVFTGRLKDERATFYDMNNGKPLGRLPESPTQGAVRWYFSPSGRFSVLSSDGDKGVVTYRLIAVPSGQVICELPALMINYLWSFSFSRDEALIAVHSRNDALMHVFDAATGKLIQKVGKQADLNDKNSFAPVRSFFSSDGRQLASWSMSDRLLRVWDISSGKERLQLPLVPGNLGNLAFAWSPDNRVISVGDDRSIQLWELATLSVRRKLQGHLGAVRALAFSPDGTVLASGSTDTTVLIWDIAMRDAGKQVAPADMEKHWLTLAGDDAAKAFTAMCDLAADPKGTVPWVKEKIKPVKPADPKRVTELIGQLDSNVFKIRESVLNELAQIGDQIVPHVEAALAAKPSLEARLRLQELHVRMTSGVLKTERLQAYRAIELLERIGNEQAVQTLQSLADGAPSSLVTTQAQAALARRKK